MSARVTREATVETTKTSGRSTKRPARPKPEPALRETRERFLTGAEMARALGVTTRKLLDLKRAGVVRAVKLGHRTLRFPESQLDQLAAELAKGGE